MKNFHKTIIECLVVFTTFLLISSPVCQSAMSESMVDRIVDAIYLAEGGVKAKKPFGILSVPCRDYKECRVIAKNTVRNNFERWLKHSSSITYLQFLASRYAPIGASNDYQGLNQYWLKNVQFFLYAEDPNA